MNVRIIAGLGAMFLVFALPAVASAGVWVWGCQGQIGDQQVAYNRYFLSVLPAKEKLGALREIIDRTNIVENGDPASTYELAESDGSAFSPVMKFQRHNDADHAVVLTQKSSKKISSRKRLICGRDESTDTYRKIYTYQRETEPARDITMQCIEFQLSTRGGRKGCD